MASDVSLHTHTITYGDAPLTGKVGITLIPALALGGQRKLFTGISEEQAEAALQALYSTQGYHMMSDDTGIFLSNTHTHRICLSANCGHEPTHSSVSWDAWTSSTSLPTTAGYYYLNTDVTLSTSWNPPDGVNLCLNGHVVAGPSGDYAIKETDAGSTFSITDCNTGSRTRSVTVDETTGRWTLVQTGEDTTGKQVKTVNGGIITGDKGIYIQGATGDNSSAKFYLYGGTVCGFASNGVTASYADFYLYGGAISGNSVTGNGAGIMMSTGNCYLYGGQISDNRFTGDGGGLYLTNANCYLYGGQISDNTAGLDGAIGMLYGTTRFEMYGGTISNNHAARQGTLYVAGESTFVMYGGTASENSSQWGGFAMVGTNGTFEMRGGTISNNTATVQGGGVYVNGTFQMYGGTISGNTAVNGGGLYMYEASATSTIYSGTISTNTATSWGGGVGVMGGTLEMQGGLISNNTATSWGGGVGVYFGKNSSATMRSILSGSATVKDNTVQGDANDFYLMGTASYKYAPYLALGEQPLSGSIGITIDQTLANGQKLKLMDGLSSAQLAAVPGFLYSQQGYTLTAEDDSIYLSHQHGYTTSSDPDAKGDTILANPCPLGIAGCSSGSVTIYPPTSLTYTGSTLTAYLVYSNDWKDAKDLTITYSSDPITPGEYTASVTKGGATAKTTYVILPAKLTDVGVTQTEALTYTGQPQTAQVDTKATAVNDQPVTFTYSATQDGTYTAAVPAFTQAGKHTVYYQASAPNHDTASGEYTVTISGTSDPVVDPDSETIILPGQDGLTGTDGSPVVKPSGNPSKEDLDGMIQPDGSVQLPSGGTVVLPDGTKVEIKGPFKIKADGTITLPYGSSATITRPDGSTESVDGPATIHPDGSVEKEELPTTPVVNPDQSTITLPGQDGVTGTTDDPVVKPSGNPSKEDLDGMIQPDGSVLLPNGGTVTYPDSSKVEINGPATVYPDGSIVLPDGDSSATVQTPDGFQNTITGPVVVEPNGTTNGLSSKPVVDSDKGTITLPGKDGLTGTTNDPVVKPSGNPSKEDLDGMIQPDGSVLLPDSGGTVTLPGGTEVEIEGSVTIKPDGTIVLPNGFEVEIEGSATIKPDGTIDLPNGGSATITKPDGSTETVTGPVVIQPDGTVNSAPKLVSIRITTYPDKTQYTYGDSFDPTGLVLTATYEDGSTVEIPYRADNKNDFLFSAALDAGTQTVTVTYGGLTDTMNVVVDRANLEVVAVVYSEKLTFTGEPLTPEVTFTVKSVNDQPVTITYSTREDGVYTDEVPSFVDLGKHTVYYQLSAPNHEPVFGEFTVEIVEAEQLSPGDPDDPNDSGDTGSSGGSGSTGNTGNSGGSDDIGGSTETADSTAHICPSAEFTDLDVSQWYHEATDYVLLNQQMVGYGNSLFGPDDLLSRSMLACMLHSAAGKPVGAEDIFTDVVTGMYCAKAVNWAGANGIAAGYTDGSFGPHDFVTREQLAVMLWRYAGSPAATQSELSFADSDKVSPWALDAILWATEKGILISYPGNQLLPTGTTKRAEAAQIFQQFMKQL